MATREGRPRPRLGLTVGDPAGVGPELILPAARALAADAELVVFGPERVRPGGLPEGVGWMETPGPERWSMGAAQAECGRAAIEALRAGHEAATDGSIDALVTAPVSKEALHLAGEPVEGQTQLLSRWAGVEAEMMAIAGDLRVLLLTRHMALREALERITPTAVECHLCLLDRTLRQWGWEAPRLALAGLNPHAGEGGLFGDEERSVLEPAARAARDHGVDVTGPLSPDTVFLRAPGRFDAVLALYHDQAFLPVKTAAPDGGVTLLCGLPYLRLSPAHGTAFDIAGRGTASPRNLIEALREAGRWVARRQSLAASAAASRAAEDIDAPSR